MTKILQHNISVCQHKQLLINLINVFRHLYCIPWSAEYRDRNREIVCPSVRLSSVRSWCLQRALYIRWPKNKTRDNYWNVISIFVIRKETMKFLIVLVSVLGAALGQLAGGWSTQDPSNEEYMELLTNYTTMGMLKELHGYTIVSVETQVRMPRIK